MPNQSRPYLRGLLTGSALTLLALAAIPVARQSLRPLMVAAVRGARSAGEQAVAYWERTKEDFEDIWTEANPDPGLSEPPETPKA
jgi:hypothetical protein